MSTRQMLPCLLHTVFNWSICSEVLGSTSPCNPSPFHCRANKTPFGHFYNGLFIFISLMNKLTCLLQETKKHFGMKLRTVESMCVASSTYRKYAQKGLGLNFYPQTQAAASSFFIFESNCRAPTMGQILCWFLDKCG